MNQICVIYKKKLSVFNLEKKWWDQIQRNLRIDEDIIIKKTFSRFFLIPFVLGDKHGKNSSKCMGKMESIKSKNLQKFPVLKKTNYKVYFLASQQIYYHHIWSGKPRSAVYLFLVTKRTESLWLSTYWAIALFLFFCFKLIFHKRNKIKLPCCTCKFKPRWV